MEVTLWRRQQAQILNRQEGGWDREAATSANGNKKHKWKVNIILESSRIYNIEIKGGMYILQRNREMYIHNFSYKTNKKGNDPENSNRKS